jgi:hypothetical protein
MGRIVRTAALRNSSPEQTSEKYENANLREGLWRVPKTIVFGTDVTKCVEGEFSEVASSVERSPAPEFTREASRGIMDP